MIADGRKVGILNQDSLILALELWDLRFDQLLGAPLKSQPGA